MVLITQTNDYCQVFYFYADHNAANPSLMRALNTNFYNGDEVLLHQQKISTPVERDLSDNETIL